MIKVVHCQKEPFDIYIGRGKGSILGNPFTHLPGRTLAVHKVNSREEAVAAFERYAWERMHTDLPFLTAILTCENKILGCYCKPKSCHGDTFEGLIQRWRQKTLWI